MPNNVNLSAAETGDTAADSPKLKFKTLLESPNIAKYLKEEYCNLLGQQVVEGYLADRSSRSQWEQRSAKSIKLALQVVETKSFPWTGCSNVKFPLVTIAALQFLSRVAILTKGRKLAKCDIIGMDPDGKHRRIGNRIAAHLSYQLLLEKQNWIDEDEKAKFSASIVGCAFKKTFFDSVEGTNVSCHVPAAMLVVDYFTKDIDEANRITHLIPMTCNDVSERVRRGLFLPVSTDMPNYTATTLLEQTSDELQGITAPSDDSVQMYSILEQHCWLDLDGDGYQEPYIVYVREDTAQCLRVVARYFDQGDVYRKNDSLVRKLRADSMEAADVPEALARYNSEIEKLQTAADNIILRIVPQRCFTKIPFIPSPDGGFYDLGLGSLLGPNNEAVNSLLNQLIDNGTLSNLGGGFLGRGVEMKGGSAGFAPGEWKTVDSTGDDLRKSMVPLPVNAPSTVLFELLQLLIGYGERISGSTDIMSGVSPGQNTPAETSRNTIEQGMKIFSGIYGRMHRAFGRELTKYVELNRLYLEDTSDFLDLVSGEGAMIARTDYRDGKFFVRPAADPVSASETQLQQKAMMLAERAGAVPGYNRYEVELDLLSAFDVADTARLFPDPNGPRAVAPPKNPKVEIEMQKLQLKSQELQQNVQLAIADLQQKAQLNAAKITELQAKAEKELAEAKGVETGHLLAAIDAQIGAAKAQQEGMLGALALMQKAVQHSHEMELSHEQAATAASNGQAQA